MLGTRLFQSKHMQSCKNYKIQQLLNRIVDRNCCYFPFLILAFNAVKCWNNWINLVKKQTAKKNFFFNLWEMSAFWRDIVKKAIRHGDQSTKKNLCRRSKVQSAWQFEGYVKDKEKISDIKMSRYNQHYCFHITSNSLNLHQFPKYCLQFFNIL